MFNFFFFCVVISFYCYRNLFLFFVILSFFILEFAGITVSDVLEFIDDGQSVIVAGDSRLGDATRELASECSIEFDQSGTFVIDHFNFDGSDDGNHNLIGMKKKKKKKKWKIENFLFLK